MKRLLPLGFLLLCAGLSAHPDPFDALDVSLSAAVALPGIVQASWDESFAPGETVSFLSRVSPALKLVADWFPLPRLGPTLALHYAALLLPQDIDLGYWDGRQHVLPRSGIHFTEVEAGIKYRHPVLSRGTLEPAVCLGYCHTFSTSVDARDNGLILDLLVEAKMHLRKGHVVATVGFMSQLFGGVEGIAWVRSYPVPYLCLGGGL